MARSMTVNRWLQQTTVACGNRAVNSCEPDEGGLRGFWSPAVLDDCCPLADRNEFPLLRSLER